jgi:hypothetical protein
LNSRERIARPYKGSFYMVKRPDADCTILGGCDFIASELAQRKVHGENDKGARRQNKRVGPYNREASNIARGFGLQKGAAIMKIFRRIFIMLRDLQKKECTIDLNGTSNHISRTLGNIDKKTAESSTKLDQMMATIDGDPNWFLTLERRRTSRD